MNSIHSGMPPTALLVTIGAGLLILIILGSLIYTCVKRSRLREAARASYATPIALQESSSSSFRGSQIGPLNERPNDIVIRDPERAFLH